ncbi:uncharacterized protein LOC142236356 [Haematobia irritans]|uniref:uncharacterized protein LOC142236356 n=1 Tax=Haematobia irritans TaxID=7368 RepID=UPI003F50A3E2
MVILMSCCCWDDVWQGSFASGVYTLIFYAFSSSIGLMNIIDDWDFFLGKRSRPRGETILEKGDITKTHVLFNIVTASVSMGLVFSSVLLIFGLKRKKRELFLPWILMMMTDLLVEFSYIAYFAVMRHVDFDPINGFIFTLIFFITTLNIYCILCVISQYQLYKTIESLNEGDEENVTPTTHEVYPR